VALALAWVFEWTPEGIFRESADTAAPSGRSGKNLDRFIVFVLVVAVAFFAFDKFVIDPARDAKKIEAATEQALATSRIESFGDRSIVVLPFLNMSPDPDQEYFADGISEELLNLLTRIEELRVISRSTAWTFKGEKVDVPAVQNKLNVSHIVEGSVRKSGNQVRITAQLIDARTDTHLWSETYERTLDEISAHIVSELKLKLLEGAPRSIVIDPRAYELYMQARYVTRNNYEENIDMAERQLRKVLKLEPAFVPAIWELTGLVASKEEMADSASQRAQLQANVDELIERMAELDPTSSYANGWIAHRAAWREHDYQKAARHYELAVAGGTDSNRIFQLGQSARFMAFLGRTDEAIDIFEFVLSRDPACSECIGHFARMLRDAGHHRQAAEQFEKVLKWHTPSPWICWNLGVAWLVAGEPEKALESFNNLEDPAGDNLGRLLALHSLGRHDEFEEEFANFHELNADGLEGIARVYAWTGQNDLAFEWLDRMVEKKGSHRAFEVKTELYEPIKTDPRWQAFLERNGAVDQNLSHIVFNPQLPAADWRPAEPRPAVR